MFQELITGADCRGRLGTLTFLLRERGVSEKSVYLLDLALKNRARDDLNLEKKRTYEDNGAEK